ncbi:DUF3857 domain-containing protein [Mucilaginibacter sp. HMF5004]|uniref:DUF3857 domain-containing protein n=1 Tax=Mucilaginibacter rivuli TaxID=2857527 RepID=UPI001C607652|nr:DUF3857 domain-containing protein [Mucilaginibacter rivuli]MBW4888750.1 DUF3857 domain-containing protein [Mucilaginibacter rivuli]
MKLRLLIIACLLTTGKLFAQEDTISYANKAAQLQKEIWGKQAPEFNVTAIPAGMAKESAVIIAHAYTSQRTSNGKTKFMIVSTSTVTKTIRVNTLHERIKINDKVALEDYSKLSYQKKLDKTVSLMLFNKLLNTHNTFIGAKLVKPDGKEIVVNTSEEVLVKNEDKDQKGILAIPGLQVGDILDYYISTVEVNEDNKGNSFKDNEEVIVLMEEYPALYFSLDFQFNSKLKVKCMYANNAPHFVESKNDAGDQLYSLKMTNVPKFESKLWTSPLRQFPYIEIGSSYGNAYTDNIKGTEAFVSKGSMLEATKQILSKAFTEMSDVGPAEKRLKKFFNSPKPTKDESLDSVMKVMYDEYKYLAFDLYNGDEIKKFHDLNYRKASDKVSTISMSLMLSDLGVDHDVLMVCSRLNNTLANVYGLNDFTAAIRINGEKQMYMFFDDVMTHFNEVPARYQGEKVIVMHPVGGNSKLGLFTSTDSIMPVFGIDKNHSDEKLTVNMMPDMQKLKLTWNVKQDGNLRHGDQKLLIPVEDVDNAFMDAVNGDPIETRLKQQALTKKMSDDFTFSFEKEREEMNKNFIEKIKDQFDQEPQQLTDFKVINPALESSAPTFNYTATFVLDNLVKKAGDNYIIDAGKLTGGFLTLDEKDKNRVLDVYMPEARSFSYTITLAIPKGYVAKGMEEMTNSKANKTGSFSSVAKVNATGTAVTITVNRNYAHNFEKAEDWGLMKEIIEAASTFNDQKILFEKKG